MDNRYDLGDYASNRRTTSETPRSSDHNTNRNTNRRPYNRRKQPKSKAPVVFMLILLIAACILAVTTFTFASKYSKSEQERQAQSQSVEEYKQKATEMEKKYNEEKKNADEWKKKYDNLVAVRNGDKKVAYLTFDDGPSENTLKIIDILKKYDIKATFFVIGSSNVEYMKNIVESGNQIALHSYSHDYSEIYRSADAYMKDLKKIHDLVKEKTGRDCKAIRFPGGASNTISAEYCKGIMSVLTEKVHDKGYEYYDWDCDSTDASGTNVEPAKLVAGVNNTSHGKLVTVLMHDTKAKSTTVEALPQIIETLKAKGYDFDTLDNCPRPCHHSVNN